MVNSSFRKKLGIAFQCVSSTGLIILGLTLLIAVSGCFERRYAPPRSVVALPAKHLDSPAYDLWGRSIYPDEAQQLLQTAQGRAMLSPANGAIRIDEALLKLGEDAFYKETFGNEVFLTDVMGILDGPLTVGAIQRAIKELHGQATSNLRVPLDKDALVGGRQFHKGEVVDTGLDVPKGAIGPMGMAVIVNGPKIMVGVTCALCHSTVDPETKQVIHGAPNGDLNAGLLIALASNSAAFFTHTDADPRKFASHDPSLRVIGDDGTLQALPDPEAFEKAVDAEMLQWPPGSFDSMTDLVAAPSQIPTSWTSHAFPYSWSGAFRAGPFNGLSVQNNNVHALNSDALTEADASPKRLGIDRQLFYGTVLHRSVNKRYRFHPASGKKPSDFFQSVDPTPTAPGMNEMVALPTYPNATLIEPTSLWSSDPGRPVWQKINAMSAWQNTLTPPKVPIDVDQQTIDRGRAVFERANCATCHSGPALTNNRIIPAPEIGTQPHRAKGMANTGHAWQDPPLAYAFDQRVPLPKNPRTLPVPTNGIDPEQMRLAYGWGDSPGGFKVPHLVGLYYTAPYLHDGGVAVGANPQSDVGIGTTLLSWRHPDPTNSLRAVIDRDLRRRVIDANHANPQAAAMHVEGIGHEYWIDPQAGFSADDQRAVILYLLTFQPANSR